MADNICAQLGDKVREGPCEQNGAVADGKISKKKITRYVERTRASDLKNLEDFGNDKEKFPGRQERQGIEGGGQGCLRESAECLG